MKKNYDCPAIAPLPLQSASNSLLAASEKSGIKRELLSEDGEKEDDEFFDRSHQLSKPDFNVWNDWEEED